MSGNSDSRDRHGRDKDGRGQAANGVDTEPSRAPWYRRIPRTLFGGRVRTTTVAMIIAFVGLFALYGQATEYYDAKDSTAADRAAVQSAKREAEVQRRISQQRDQYTPTTTTRTSTDDSPIPTTSPISTTPETGADEPSATTTTTTPTTTRGWLPNILPNGPATGNTATTPVPSR